MSGLVMGIDPGHGGALALLDRSGELLDVRDMPTVIINDRRRVSGPEVGQIVKMWKPDISIIERVGAMPKQGVSGMFAFGYAAGLVEGICVAADVSVVFVSPVTWKKMMNVPADKGACRLAAQRMWPKHSQQFNRVRDDGRAEAALIASYHILKWDARS